LGEKKGFMNPEIIKALSEGASLQELPQIPREIKELFVTSFEISRCGTSRSRQPFRIYR